MKTMICKRCGKKFKPTDNYVRRYCSRECSALAGLNKNKDKAYFKRYMKEYYTVSPFRKLAIILRDIGLTDREINEVALKYGMTVSCLKCGKQMVPSIERFKHRVCEKCGGMTNGKNRENRKK